MAPGACAREAPRPPRGGGRREADDDQLLDVPRRGPAPRGAQSTPSASPLQRAAGAGCGSGRPRPAPGFWPSLTQPEPPLLSWSLVGTGGLVAPPWLTSGAPLPPARCASACPRARPAGRLRGRRRGAARPWPRSRDAIADGDVRGPPALAELQAELADLSAEDRAEVGPDARALLRRADVFLSQDEPGVATTTRSTRDARRRPLQLHRRPQRRPGDDAVATARRHRRSGTTRSRAAPASGTSPRRARAAGCRAPVERLERFRLVGRRRRRRDDGDDGASGGSSGTGSGPLGWLRRRRSGSGSSGGSGPSGRLGLGRRRWLLGRLRIQRRGRPG